MLDIKFVRDNPDAVKENIKKNTASRKISRMAKRANKNA